MLISQYKRVFYEQVRDVKYLGLCFSFISVLVLLLLVSLRRLLLSTGFLFALFDELS